MIPGPDILIRCPHCGAKARYATIVSGNSGGATNWSDGKRDLPMLPSPPRFVRCARCGHCDWLEDAPRCDEAEVDVDDREAPGRRRPTPSVPYVLEASEADMLQALEHDAPRMSPERERDLRVLAWWKSNDRARSGRSALSRPGWPPGGITTDRSAPERPSAREPSRSAANRTRNLRALLPLLAGADVTHTLMRCEIHRQLGEFDEARRQLSGLTDPRYASVVAQFAEFCEARDSGLRRLRLG